MSGNVWQLGRRAVSPDFLCAEGAGAVKWRLRLPDAPVGQLDTPQGRFVDSNHMLAIRKIGQFQEWIGL